MSNKHAKHKAARTTDINKQNKGEQTHGTPQKKLAKAAQDTQDTQLSGRQHSNAKPNMLRIKHTQAPTNRNRQAQNHPCHSKRTPESCLHLVRHVHIMLLAARWVCAFAVCTHVAYGQRSLSHRKMFSLQRTCHPRGFASLCSQFCCCSCVLLLALRISLFCKKKPMCLWF